MMHRLLFSFKYVIALFFFFHLVDWESFPSLLYVSVELFVRCLSQECLSGCVLQKPFHNLSFSVVLFQHLLCDPLFSGWNPFFFPVTKKEKASHNRNFLGRQKKQNNLFMQFSRAFMLFQELWLQAEKEGVCTHPPTPTSYCRYPCWGVLLETGIEKSFLSCTW